MEYKIIKADYPVGDETETWKAGFFSGPGGTATYLECEVRKAIKDGWKPLGSPFIRHGAQSGAEFYQAMTKE